MPSRYSKGVLRALRNEVPVAHLIAEILDVPSKISESYFRFLCPLCHEFNTATNPRTNLARCFRCQRNFNPIDLVMLLRHANFTEAVQFLLELRNAPRHFQETPHAHELARDQRPDRAPAPRFGRHARDGARDDPPEPLGKLPGSR
ncbi:MAG: hypothetical protein HY721_29045 [Planctomycetes bacterium]|nr:hypothetical protein [Planctomycetota bacterium]